MSSVVTEVFVASPLFETIYHVLNNCFRCFFFVYCRRRKKVLRPKMSETTALGAAFAAGLAVGVWEDIDDLSKTWALGQEYEATMAAEKRDMVGYVSWCVVYAVCRGCLTAVADVRCCCRCLECSGDCGSVDVVAIAVVVVSDASAAAAFTANPTAYIFKPVYPVHPPHCRHLRLVCLQPASLELAACGRAIAGLGGDRGKRKGGRGRGQRSLGGGGGGKMGMWDGNIAYWGRRRKRDRAGGGPGERKRRQKQQ